MAPDEIRYKKVLLVEGEDEKNVFTALLRFLNISEVDVIPAGGKENFKGKFSVLSKRTNFDNIENLGFIRDAEENAAKSSFGSMYNIIAPVLADFALPKTPGEVARTGSKTCGIFIMPDCASSGMLEDLCIKSVENQDLFKNANEYVEKAKAEYEKDKAGNKKFNMPKALVQAYLAGRVPVVNSLGLAVQKKYFDFNNVAFDSVKKFLKELFC